MNIIEQTLTKRNVSSFIAGIYDPLGLILPYTMLFRMEIRILWQAEFDWDDLITGEHESKLKNLMNEVNYVKMIKLPRNVIVDLNDQVDLLIYCDASKHAIGAVAYSLNSNGNMYLIMARGKLA